MLRSCTIIFPLLCSLGLSPLTLAASDDKPLVLRQVLAGFGEETCVEPFPTLRSTSLHEALTSLYEHGGQAALWQNAERLSDLKDELQQLADDGLEPEDYAFALHSEQVGDPCAELRISSEYLLALEHLSRGRLRQADHEALWLADALPPASLPDLPELARIGIDQGMSTAFDRARPALPEYRELRAAYAAMDRQPSARPLLPAGPLLRPGMADSRIPQIATLLQQEGFLPKNGIPAAQVDVYDEAMAQSVRHFQANQGLEPDGVVGPQTLNAMNVSPAQRVQQVRINLERLRWINAWRSEYLLLVNVASGQLQLLRGNETLWQARAQTGRPSRPTPALVSRINRITLNPSWTVPPTILREDILPQVRRDTAYLEQRGMLALDAQGKHLDPQQVNWNNPRGVMLRQPPGPSNPLGRFVFRLPNPFAVYLHDTPSQQLFQQANRNVSSGCVRVENADELARQLFDGLSSSQRARIDEGLAGGSTHEISLTDGPQVIFAYWTAYADSRGRAAFVPDSYALDPALAAALGGLRIAALNAGVMTSADIAQRAEAGCAFFDA